MIRILHIITSTSTMNGVLHVIMNYYHNINRNKVQFDFLYFKDSECNFNAEIEELGGKLYRISKPSLSYISRSEITNFFNKHADDYVAIHCHDIFGVAIFGKAARATGVSHIIQHSHTTKFSDKRLRCVRNYLMLEYGKRYITEYMACSQAALNIFSKKELRSKPSHILYNAINLNRFSFSSQSRQEIRRQFGIGQNDFVVGNVARFNPQKNHQLLLESFARLKSKIPSSKLLLVGDGPLKTQIVNTARELGIDGQVIFAGTCQDSSKFYSAFDVFVLTSRFEGLVVAGIESQANGLPTICSPNVSDETKVSKFFCKYKKDNPESVIETVLNNRQLRLTSAIQHDDILPEYDIVKQAEQLEKFYLNLQNRHSPGR